MQIGMAQSNNNRSNQDLRDAKPLDVKAFVKDVDRLRKIMLKNDPRRFDEGNHDRRKN